jgi:O-glycosyl hydrolase
MKKRLSLMAMSLGLSMMTTAALSQGTSVQTCSAAYDVCFNACSQQFPGGTDASAKCIDKCAMSRAKCDRNGCFKSNSVNVCGIAKE